jgi:hypothetical protein
MYELDWRATLTPEELEQRAYLIPFKLYDYALLQRLDKYSMELEQTWDYLINAAIKNFMDDIEAVHRLRKFKTASEIEAD